MTATNILINASIVILAILSSMSAFANFSIIIEPPPQYSACDKKWDKRNVDRFHAGGSINVLAAIVLVTSLFLGKPLRYYTSLGSLAGYAVLNGLLYYDVILPNLPPC